MRRKHVTCIPKYGLQCAYLLVRWGNGARCNGSSDLTRVTGSQLGWALAWSSPQLGHITNCRMRLQGAVSLLPFQFQCRLSMYSVSHYKDKAVLRPAYFYDGRPTPETQWRGALMFSLIGVWINGCVNNRAAGDLRRHRTHYNVIVMFCTESVITS